MITLYHVNLDFQKKKIRSLRPIVILTGGSGCHRTIVLFYTIIAGSMFTPIKSLL